MHILDYVRLFQLARNRLRSREDYLRFQLFQGQQVVKELVEQGILFRGKRVLDLGCGFGGYSQALAGAGGMVTTVDLDAASPVRKDSGISFVRADVLASPFLEGSFDFVFCSSVIEHVEDPLRLLQEIYRLLSPGSLCYLSFPPFYSPVGGHQFKPFHLFGERLAIRMCRRRVEKIRHSWVKEHQPAKVAGSGYRSAFGLWGLYPLSIRRAKTLVRSSGLSVLRVSTRFAPLSLARVPIIGELLTWHVQIIARRQV